MRYYDLIETPKTGKTFLEDGSNRVHQSDESVKCWFEPLPDGKSRGFSDDGYPILSDIVEPTNSELFTAELDSLNAECDKNIKEAVEKYSYAVAIDGSTETDKVTSARAEITELNVQYGIDQASLINKYYGE